MSKDAVTEQIVVRAQNGLSKHEVNEIFRLLHKERSELLVKQRPFRSELSGCQPSADPCDNMEGEVFDTINLTDKQRKKLRRLESAIARLKLGTYGCCENKECENDGEIGFARLKANTVAVLCIDCQETKEAEEKRVKNLSRPRMAIVLED